MQGYINNKYMPGDKIAYHSFDRNCLVWGKVVSIERVKQEKPHQENVGIDTRAWAEWDDVVDDGGGAYLAFLHEDSIKDHIKATPKIKYNLPVWF